MENKQLLELSTKLTQKQRLEQRQLMLMTLLNTSIEEMEDLINSEVESNPALEIESETEPDSESEDFSPVEDKSEDEDFPQDLSAEEAEQLRDSVRDEDNYDSNVDDWDDYVYANSSPDDKEFERQIAAYNSFRDNVFRQIGEMKLSDEDRMLAEYIVDSLPERGYFDSEDAATKECNSISNQFLFREGIRIPQEKVKQILVDVIQKLEPAGLGARSLQECLLLQLDALAQPKNRETISLAKKIIANHFENFSKKKYSIILKKEKISQEEFDAAVAIITRLNPSPAVGTESNRYVTPDFVVTHEDGEIKVSMNTPTFPRLRVNRDYEKMLEKMRKSRDKETLAFLRKNIERAKLFMDVLPQRNITMCAVMNEIVLQQKDYFLTGNRSLLKPMVLKNIAEKLQMAESTVSRVTSKRYAVTPFGTISLKELFSEAVNGDTNSAAAIRQVLKEIIDNEDKSSPYTDEKLVNVLKEKGYEISRRTVAKYRESMKIFPAHMRKEK